MVLPSNVSVFDYGSNTLYLFQDAQTFDIAYEHTGALEICRIRFAMQQKLSCCRLLDDGKILCGMWNALRVVDIQNK